LKALNTKFPKKNWQKIFPKKQCFQKNKKFPLKIKNLPQKYFPLINMRNFSKNEISRKTIVNPPKKFVNKKWKISRKTPL